MNAIRSLVAIAAFSIAGIQGGDALSLPSAASGPTVHLGYASYQGVYNATTGLNVWKGIRYAHPPTGAYRWRAPSPPTVSWTGILDANSPGSACPQAVPRPFSGAAPGNEDCLFLNVFAPKEAGKKGLPVLVWIHGGGYASGDASQDMSEILKANDNGFIAVVIQYRLGAFGFLSSEDVKADGVVNAGILDMALALKWVQAHIGKFGGDPKRVTISGESAGAGGVMLLGIARDGSLGTSLFRNSITASPYLSPQYNYNASVPTQRYVAFASEAGCGQSTDTLACLRGKDSATLQAANTAVNDAAFYGGLAFLPVTDYDFITSLPSKALANKRVNGQNILVGNNANEGTIFVPPTISTAEDVESWVRSTFPELDDALVRQILDAYPSSNVSNAKFATSGLGSVTALDVSEFATGQLQRANNIYAEATFICPSYWLNDAYTASGRKSYHYQYSVTGGLHTDDIPGYFGPAMPNQSPAFTTVFRQIWGKFIESAAPESAVGAWPTWTEGGSSQLLNLNTTGGTPYTRTIVNGLSITEFQEPGIVNNFSIANAKTWEGNRGERCDFWKQVAKQVSM
ncbi:carboxylesterase [Paraphoma chrysanthemicola]|nr:carboxylesterase [Paraphoma chrysanthemicola]